MSINPERSQSATQRPLPAQPTYEPPPLSLHDEDTLPDRYPAFNHEKTVPSRSLRNDASEYPAATTSPGEPPLYAHGLQQQQMPGTATNLPASAYPAPYRSRPFLPWLLLVVGALGGILLLTTAGFVALNAAGIHTWSVPSGHSIVAPANGSTSTPAQVASNYYTAIESKDYSRAYSYVQANAQPSDWDQGQPLNQDTYSQQAKAVDYDYGGVSNYTIYHTEMIDSSYARVLMGVRRDYDRYRVSLDLHMVDGAWHIIQFNRI